MPRSLLQRLVHELRLFLIALQFFTRIPIPAWVGFDPSWLQTCTRYFPVVGALVGVLGAAVLVATSLWWPPVVSVVLSMAFTVWVTGGFHEDGWADTCDGLGGTVSRERALEIMKDSRLGAYGGMGLVLMLGLKASLLTALLSPLVTELSESASSHVHQVLLVWTTVGVVWAHTVSRLAPVFVTGLLSYAGDAAHAKAKPLAMQASASSMLAAAVLTALVAVVMIVAMDTGGWPVPTLLRCLMWSSFAVMLVTAWGVRWFKQRLGGFTGDTLGASQQLAEVASLLAWLAVVHPVTWVRW